MLNILSESEILFRIGFIIDLHLFYIKKLHNEIFHAYTFQWVFKVYKLSIFF